jgi:hypothetical protein
MSKRQQIIDAIVARLETIQVGTLFTLPDGPYECQTTIKKVVPWHKSTFNDHELPAIEIRDLNADTEPGPSSQHEHHLPLVLQIPVGGNQPASVARAAMADVVACIGSDVRWGGLAQWTDLTGHGIMVEQAGDKVAGSQVLINVRYRTPLWRM